MVPIAAAAPSFNPRTREGCDLVLSILRLHRRRFQSTHPRGVRPRGNTILLALICFNPRTREGCDQAESRRLLNLSSFNPRTREGCDCVGDISMSINPVSIHAPARGATSISSSRAAARSGFNPRTREGCDLNNPWKSSCGLGFNPRTREGCDIH